MSAKLQILPPKRGYSHSIAMVNMFPVPVIEQSMLVIDFFDDLSFCLFDAVLKKVESKDLITYLEIKRILTTIIPEKIWKSFEDTEIEDQTYNTGILKEYVKNEMKLDMEDEAVNLIAFFLFYLCDEYILSRVNDYEDDYVEFSDIHLVIKEDPCLDSIIDASNWITSV